MPMAVTSYEFSVFIHVTAVVVGFGATFAESMLFPVAMKMSPRHLPYVHRLQLDDQPVLRPAGAGDRGRHRAVPDVRRQLGLRRLLGQRHPDDRGDHRPAAPRLLHSHRPPAAADDRAEIADAGDRELQLSDPRSTSALGNEGIVGSLTGILLIVAIFLMITKPGL